MNQKQLNKAFELYKKHKFYCTILYSFHLINIYSNHLLNGDYVNWPHRPSEIILFRAEFILIFKTILLSPFSALCRNQCFLKCQCFLMVVSNEKIPKLLLGLHTNKCPFLSKSRGWLCHVVLCWLKSILKSSNLREENRGFFCCESSYIRAWSCFYWCRQKFFHWVYWLNGFSVL